MCYDTLNAALSCCFFIYRDPSVSQCNLEKLPASEAFTKTLKNRRDPVDMKVDKVITKGDGNKTYDVPISSQAILGKVVLKKERNLSRIIGVARSVKMMTIHDIIKFLSTLMK